MVDGGQKWCYNIYTKIKRGYGMYSFNGRFNHQLDAKNRIRIPAKFKVDLGAEYKFAFGPDKSIYVLPFAEYKKILDSFGEVSFFDDETQEAIADFTSMVYDVSEDNQGRVVIPGELKEYAEIDKDIVITGAASYLRIEAQKVFEERNKNKDFKSVFAKLKSLKADK